MTAEPPLTGEEFLDIIRGLFGDRALRAYREGTGVSRTQVYRWTKAKTVPRHVQATCELLCYLRCFGCPIPAAFGPLADCSASYGEARADPPIVLRFTAGTPISEMARQVAAAVATNR